MSTFTMGNYPHQPTAVSLFMNFVNLSFLMKFESEVMKDVSSSEMSDSFVTADVLVKRTFFAFSPFLDPRL